MRAWGLWLALTACEGAVIQEPPPAAPETADEVEVDIRGPRRLVGPPVTTTRGDAFPGRELALVEGSERIALPEPALTGRITAEGAVFITEQRALIDQDGNVLDSDVELDLDVDSSGTRVAYGVRDSEGDFRVRVLDLGGGTTAHVSGALAHATTPFWLADGRLIVSGGQTNEIVGLWLLEGEGATRLTNFGMKVGEPLGPDFVPLPYQQQEVRESGGALVYETDGVPVRVEIPQ